MNKNISTEGIQEKVNALLTCLVDIVNKSKLEGDYKLILVKMIYALRDSCTLWSRASFFGAEIILRSSFEALVLLDYLLVYPEKLQEYIMDSKISSFKHCYGLYERGQLSLEEIKKIYTSLSSELKKCLLLEVYENKVILPGKIINKKNLAQQIRPMMHKLMNVSGNYDELNKYLTFYYSIPSEKVHTSLAGAIQLLEEPEEVGNLEKYQYFTKATVNIVRICLAIINKYVGSNKDIIISYVNATDELLNYLNIKEL